ncbi:PHP domain-containing protein [Methanoculleus sp. FWC-SCC1]|uniref:PHP domain-containing protein n=1 Tax=Methanoculleus frigidifontis TaxID=2584085 RepID=A0ABT8MA96_9EURY|nr:PHP-associated domain-containing protein [Methanoculleus sp. FWC-SCC1]MDN7024862.1 PHP domain-containing protein [Methanoculleus sp. FWC-SCC1]
MPPEDRCPCIRFACPDIPALRAEGCLPVDMHIHTEHSDGRPRVAALLRACSRLGIGVAITDHNQVGGVEEAVRLSRDYLGVVVIPGMEVSAADGPHILLYFSDTAELREFYDRHVREYKQESPFLAIRRTTEEILDAAEGTGAVVVAAHPFGYAFFNKGVCKCIDRGYLDPSVLDRFDGIEAICGNMAHPLNEKAVSLALQRRLPATGGTDGHILPDIGGVVTAAEAEDADGFLDAIVRKRACIVGREKNFLHKGVMGAAILPKYLPHTVPSLRIHYEQNIPRLRRFVDRSRRQRSEDR